MYVHVYTLPIIQVNMLSVVVWVNGNWTEQLSKPRRIMPFLYTAAINAEHLAIQKQNSICMYIHTVSITEISISLASTDV